MMFDVVTLAMKEPLKAGKFRALGVATAKRVDILNDVPTLTEAGFPLEMSAWFGLMAPAGTRQPVIAWLNREKNQPGFLVAGHPRPLPIARPIASSRHAGGVRRSHRGGI